MISGSQIYFILFLASRHKSGRKENFFEKVIFQAIAHLHNLFMILTNLERGPRIFVKVI